MSDKGDSWFKKYDACMQLGHDTMQEINERNKHPRTSSIFVKKSASIRSAMNQFQQDMNSLRESLSHQSVQTRMTQREADRRQGLIDQLVTKHKQLELAYDNRDTSSLYRTSLLSSTADFHDDPFASSSAAAQRDDEMLDIGQVRQQQQRMIAEQDQGLEALSRIISRQRQIAVDIGNEVDSQNDLIDDITDHVDQTNTRLIRETGHISTVSRKSNTCWMWIVIVLLLVAIIVIIAVPKPK